MMFTAITIALMFVALTLFDFSTGLSLADWRSWAFGASLIGLNIAGYLEGRLK